MKILNIETSSFSRIIWYDLDARLLWESRLKRARELTNCLEIASVREGLRKVCTTHISPQNLPQRTGELARQGLIFLPTQATGTYGGGFSHKFLPVEQGKPWDYFGVVSLKKEDALAFAEAQQHRDNQTMGKLLGYPACCRDWFDEVWPTYVDPIWQIKGDPLDVGEDKHLIWKSVSASPYTQAALRYIGLWWSPAFPCDHLCERHTSFGQGFAELGHKIDSEAAEWLDILMRMPFRWSALKGVAEITTPLFKIITNSIPCWPRHDIYFHPVDEVWPEKGNKIAKKGLRHAVAARVNHEH